MPHSIKAARQRKNIRSNDALASLLLTNYPETFKGDNPRSLSKQIGDLDREDGSWWLKREDKMSCLLEVLGIDADDLKLQKKAGRHTFAPAMFPDFPALSLVREETWVIAEPRQLLNDAPVESSRYHTKPTLDFWLAPGAIGVGPHQTQWLCVQDNVEFDLLTRKLDAVSRHEVVFGHTISDVLEKHLDSVRHHAALIVVIRSEEGGENLQLLIELRQGAPLLIISPWAPPALPDVTHSKRAAIEGPSRKLEFESWIWTLLPNWRELLLEWIEQRFKQTNTDSYFSSGAACQLLDKFDPSLQWFTRVEDVLVLAQAVADFREHDLKRAIGSGADVSALLELLFGRGDANLGLIERLVQSRWTSWHLPWLGDLSDDEWATLAAGVCQFDVLLAQFITRNAGGYDFKRPIVIRLLLRSYLIGQINRGNVAAWLPACFDEQRRPLLDAALDALSVSELEELALRLSSQLAQPEYLGAGEALFVAVGRRLVRGEPISNTLPNILGAVVQRLRREKEVRIPYSRSLHTPASQVEWISICWAWSLRTESDGEAAPSWQFPGWSDKLPAKVPDWLNSYGASYSPYSWDRLPLRMQDFLGVVRRWLTMLETSPQYERMPPVVMSAMLAHATDGVWPAQADWWTAVIGNPGAEQALLNVVMSDQAHTRRQLALAWWPSLVAYRHQEYKRMASFSSGLGASLFTRYSRDHHYSSLLAWVMEQLEPDPKGALNILAEEDLVFLMRHPSQLSPAFKSELLKAVGSVHSLDLFPFEIPGFLFAYGPEASLEMEALLDNEKLGAQAAYFLWKWAPRKAALLLGHEQLTQAAVRNLLTTSPPLALEAALTVLRKRPQLLSPAERLAWAKDRLSNARQHAAELLQLMQDELQR